MDTDFTAHTVVSITSPKHPGSTANILVPSHTITTPLHCILSSAKMAVMGAGENVQDEGTYNAKASTAPNSKEHGIAAEVLVYGNNSKLHCGIPGANPMEKAYCPWATTTGRERTSATSPMTGPDSKTDMDTCREHYQYHRLRLSRVPHYRQWLSYAESSGGRVDDGKYPLGPNHECGCA
jgi:hypothetical protein